MKVAKFTNGFIYRHKDLRTDEELQEALNDGFVQISDEDYKLYSTLEYTYDNGKPKKVVVCEIPLDTLKREKMLEVDQWTESKITGGFISNTTGKAVRYDSDKDTQLTMQGIALNVDTALFAEKYPNGCPVRGYAEGANEKSVFFLTADQVMRWCADLSIHIGDCKQAGWAKQAEVQAATSREELDAIVL